MAFTDNVSAPVATPGTGATFRALASYADGVEWPPELAAYAVNVNPGFNVLQVVTPQYPLPVVSSDANDVLQRILQKLQQSLCLPDPDQLDTESVLNLLLAAFDKSRAGAANFALITISAITTTPTQVFGRRPTRRAATIINAGTTTVYLLDPSNSQTTLGMPMLAGASVQMNTTAPIFFVTASGTGTLDGWEEFD